MSKVITNSLESINSFTDIHLQSGNTNSGKIGVYQSGGLRLFSNSNSLKLDISSNTISVNNYLFISAVNFSGDVPFIMRGGDAIDYKYIAGTTIGTYNTSSLFTNGLIKLDSNNGASSTIILATNNTPRMIINSDGNTVIGDFTVANAPNQKLVIGGDFYAKDTITQTIYYRVNTKATYSYPVAVAGQDTSVIIGLLNASITPRRSTSKILIKYCLTYECWHDAVFRIYRNDGVSNTRIGVNTLDSNYWSGTWVSTYDKDTGTTPITQTMMILDAPGTTRTCTYSFAVQSSDVGTGSIFNLNRSYDSVGSDTNEVGISSILIQEIGDI
jgi:hypothetical protein